MNSYEAVIGLEVHVQLNTAAKIFCSCSAEFGAEANSHVCPVCMGFPGTLPVLNGAAVDKAVQVGLALGCEIQKFSIFDRKSYFYPDLPKAYQITQMFYPICLGGSLNIDTKSGSRRINLTRIHMEEDAGKLIHGEGESAAYSYVDFNRASVPLVEIVSEPDIRSAEEARLYLQKLRTILRYINVSDCNMEEGSLRCDANISIRPVGEAELGTKVEIKNMNSFRNVQHAIEYEIARQTEILSEGGHIRQQTRLWDNDRGITLAMRSKENAHDYRYFPDPDLFPLKLTDEKIERLKKTIPELPDSRKARFMQEYSLSAQDADLLVSEKDYADFYEDALKIYSSPKNIANWIMSELLRVVNQKGLSIFNAGVAPADIAQLVKLIESGAISGKQGKEVFAEAVETGKTPEAIVSEKGLSQLSDKGELYGIVQKVVKANPSEAERFKSGEEKLLGFFVGLVIKESRGKANPKLVNEILKETLK
ncbi:MAG: Asp-tRNA(Asn)/Glu-tRNA(Gln) amidotransferase subunit GatB [Deferribacteraceae bacterium]|jgi:aspartyl-tRNA(Asn)/glutamyl-tRNA(Gln) amidotransferase subunit B|nr:Asp-tRNA(Asn)/Glu-tRNA(Gln) amidotransferase subunit GatB [Deferribacteraceae bacterium]